ncbi:signal peptidase II [Rosistilla oblonga]|nr:signal peptidase II [Rosistilla oblonga]
MEKATMLSPNGDPQVLANAPADRSNPPPQSRDGSPLPHSNPLPAIPTNRYITFFALAILGAVADLWTKQAMFAWRGLPGMRPPHWVVEGYVGIETAVNIGAVFGIGAGKGQLFAAISVVAAIAIFIWLFVKRAAHQWLLTIALGCVMGGIIGNLYDRLGLWWEPGMDPRWQSGVRDWILFQASDTLKWPNFNIADSLLVCGAAMLIYRSFFPVDEFDDDKPNSQEDSNEAHRDNNSSQ